MIQTRKFVTSLKDFFPRCVDCKNFIRYIENNIEYDGLGKCKKFGYFLPNSLGNVNFYAVSCRMNNDKNYCGEGGRHYEKK